ncbi:MAG: PEP-CTERM sorting domain-containing protein [Acidobacteriia bacterium]|nr:PEP-CTERM sorting domain-containing protein [Terriglobia bacterium]
MIKQLLCATVFLLGATALRADVFSFTYTGTISLLGTTTTVSETGTLTANALSALTPDLYTITNISGTRTSTSGKTTDAWTIFDPPGAGFFIYSSPSSNSGTIYFSLRGYSSNTDTVTFGSGTGTEIGPNLVTSGTFKITRVPEPAVLLLLLTMGLGVWVLARKLPSNKSPLS